MMTAHALDMAKAAFALGAAGLAYIAKLGQENLGAIAPEWVKWAAENGTTGVFLVCLIYAIVTLARAHKESVAGRLKDRDSFIEIVRKDAAKSQEQAEKAVEALSSHQAAMDNQAKEFERMGEELSRLRDKVD